MQCKMQDFEFVFEFDRLGYRELTSVSVHKTFADEKSVISMAIICLLADRVVCSHEYISYLSRVPTFWVQYTVWPFKTRDQLIFSTS